MSRQRVAAGRCWAVGVQVQLAHAVHRNGGPSGRPKCASGQLTDLYTNVTTHSTYRCRA